MSKRTFEQMSTEGQVTGLPKGTASLLATGEWSDMVIKCKHRRWKVHRVVVCLQSKPFAESMKDDLKGFKGIVDLSDQKPEIVDYMVRFMYTGNYTADHSVPKHFDRVIDARRIEDEAHSEDDDENDSEAEDDDASSSSEKSESEDEEEQSERLHSLPVAPEPLPIKDPLSLAERAAAEILIHTDVYLLAEEKEIASLQAASLKKYARALKDGWDSAEFCQNLIAIYKTTEDDEDELWDRTIACAGLHAKALMKRKEMVELWKENGALAVEMWNAYMRSSPTARPVPAVPAVPVVHVASAAPEGCPWYGVRHAEEILRGRKTTYYCGRCRRPFS